MQLSDLEQVSIQDIEQHKRCSVNELDNDILRLKQLPAEDNIRTFAGNKFLYHFQFENLLRCPRERGQTLYQIWADDTQRKKLLVNTVKRQRRGATLAGNIFECFRINTGSVVMFKAATAKYLYKKYSAQSVLDPTAGWGGRMLGAHSLGIKYLGIDSNLSLKPAYDNMIDYLQDSNLTMIWDNCLNVDYSQIDYDFVLTSPPYINMELYEHMLPWSDKQSYYVDFLLPLIARLKQHIKPGGRVCFNISPKMYDEAREFGLTAADQFEELKQQTGQRSRSDLIYIWSC